MASRADEELVHQGDPWLQGEPPGALDGEAPGERRSRRRLGRERQPGGLATQF